MATPIKSADLLRSAGFRFQSACFAGECAGCGAVRDADKLRVVTGGTRTVHGVDYRVKTWMPICKREQCTTAFLAGRTCAAAAGTAPGPAAATDRGWDADDLAPKQKAPCIRYGRLCKD